MRGSARDEATILHVDMDSFFVSVELLDKPELRGKPVAVSFDGARAVVSSASYEARRFGVRSAMPASRAKMLCPQLVFLPPNMQAYKNASRQIIEVFHTVTPLVEQLSIDEAFLDVAGARKLLGDPVTIAKMLRKRLHDECGLPASIGVASTKFVAKLASTKAKPDGLLVIEPAETLTFLHALPVSELWGVGTATAKALRGHAIHTVADLAAEPLWSLEKVVGKAAALKLQQLSHGIDDRAVHPDTKEKSIGHEDTFQIDLVSHEQIEKELLRLSWRTAARLRKNGIEARTIAIKVRWSDFETVTRSRTLQEASNSSERFYQVAAELFDSLREWGRPVRLLGVRAEQLQPEGASQSALWSEEEPLKAVDQAVDQVREKFGVERIAPASLLQKKPAKP